MLWLKSLFKSYLAPLDIGELAVNGQQVIDENGRWVGPTIDAERLNGLTADNIRADSADTMASELRFWI